MSLRPQVCPAVPEETVRIARASFPKGSRYMRLRDELGAVFDDSRFAGLFPTRGRPAEAPWLLALVTLFQFAEGLPDTLLHGYANPLKRLDISESVNLHKCLILLDPCRIHATRSPC